MEKQGVTRRDFIQTVSAVGIAALASGLVNHSVAGEQSAPVGKSVFVCSVCGHIEFGAAPAACPVCHAPTDKFTRNDNVFKESAEKFKTAADKHVPVVTAKKKSMLVTEKPSIEMTAKIGSVIHPMEEAHHIRFIDCYCDDKHVARLSLTLNCHPTVGLNILKPGSKVRVVTLCNLHGYWQAEATVA